jgi:hypothetical protein
MGLNVLIFYNFLVKMAFRNKLDNLVTEMASKIQELLQQHHTLTESEILQELAGNDAPLAYKEMVAKSLKHVTYSVHALYLGVGSWLYFLNEYKDEALKRKEQFIKEHK